MQDPYILNPYNLRIRKMFPKIAHPVEHYFYRNRESQPILQGFCSPVIHVSLFGKIGEGDYEPWGIDINLSKLPHTRSILSTKGYQEETFR